MIKIVSLIVLFATIASADLYLHNPRGSNDRNCERNDNRNNGNRLFDSQNNDKGGYACPRPVSPDVLPNENTMYYYEGSKLMLEWTAQHGCGDVDTGYCAIIIQYMCEDQNPLIRDGTPNDDQDSATDRMNAGQETQSRYGYHETSAYYQRCATRERNKGLYVADQNLGNSATSTRQNPNANRRGWECPEERDYYPYWHPAPWKDIAIVSTNFGQDGYPSCDYFKKNSQNNKKFGECFTADSEAVLTAKDADPNTVMDAEGVTPLKYNNEAECTSNGGYWYVRDSLGGGDPDCVGQLPVRPNSLGDDATGNMVNYVWTIPNLKPPQRSNGATQPGMKCVLRMRYNISTWETPWNLDATANDNQDEDQYQGPNEDPYIQPFAPFVADSLSTLMNTNVDGAYNLSLALNTDQYGRTFQDRSYTFFIRSRSTGMPTPGGGAPNSGEIWNVNVRGKRGNIVQTFPAVEYDFVPQYLQVTVGDHIHFQWTGSDYNPDRQPNNAEGGPEDLANSNTYRADRSNLVQLSENSPKQNIPMDFDEKKGASAFFGSNDARRMAFLDQDLANDCDDYETLLSNNNGNADQADKDRRNCYKLNAQKTPYFDGGVVKADKTGTFHFVSSRNNNFSNRSQKMKITVHPLYSAGEVAGITIGTIAGVGAAAGLGGFAYAKKYPGSRVAGVYNSALSHPLLNRFH